MTINRLDHLPFSFSGRFPRGEFCWAWTYQLAFCRASSRTRKIQISSLPWCPPFQETSLVSMWCVLVCMSGKCLRWVSDENSYCLEERWWLKNHAQQDYAEAQCKVTALCHHGGDWFLEVAVSWGSPMCLHPTASLCMQPGRGYRL